MRSYSESLRLRIRRRKDAETVEVTRRNALEAFKAKSAEALKQLDAARLSRDGTADAIADIEREMAVMRETLKPIIRSR